MLNSSVCLAGISGTGVRHIQRYRTRQTVSAACRANDASRANGGQCDDDESHHDQLPPKPRVTPSFCEPVLGGTYSLPGLTPLAM